MSIRNRFIYGIIFGSADWRMVRLRELIDDDDSKLADVPSTGRDEIGWLWRDITAEFKRAILKGDAEWFKRVTKAIENGGNPQRARFNAAVIHQFEWCTGPKQRAEAEKAIRQWEKAREKEKAKWERYIKSPEGRVANQQDRQAKLAALSQSQKEKPLIRTATLTPAGKCTDATASDIYNRLEKHEELTANGDSHLMVEGLRFESKARALEAIHDLARQLQFRLKKQAGKNKNG